MSSYDLKCGSCGHHFEVFVRGFLKDDAKVCPECGSREVAQRITAFGGVIGKVNLRPCGDGGACRPTQCEPSRGFS